MLVVAGGGRGKGGYLPGVCASQGTFSSMFSVHRAIVVTPIVHVPVPVRVRVTLAVKLYRSPYLDNHSSESIHSWTIDTL